MPRGGKIVRNQGVSGGAESTGGTGGHTALGLATQRVLPLVEERRGTVLRDTRGVARRLAVSAVDLFSDRGFEAVTVEEIATSAGVTKRTFFRYFPTKETVVLDIFDHTNAILVDRIRDEELVGEPAVALNEAVAQWCSEYEDLLQGLADLIGESVTLASAVARRSADWEDRLAVAARARFAGIDQTWVRMWSIVAMGAMRLARAQLKDGGRGFAAEVRRNIDVLFAGSGSIDSAPAAIGHHLADE
jgi:AcrR family transcriptional regulator